MGVEAELSSYVSQVMIIQSKNNPNPYMWEKENFSLGHLYV